MSKAMVFLEATSSGTWKPFIYISLTKNCPHDLEGSLGIFYEHMTTLNQTGDIKARGKKQMETKEATSYMCHRNEKVLEQRWRFSY